MNWHFFEETVKPFLATIFMSALAVFGIVLLCVGALAVARALYKDWRRF